MNVIITRTFADIKVFFIGFVTRLLFFSSILVFNLFSTRVGLLLIVIYVIANVLSGK